MKRRAAVLLGGIATALALCVARDASAETEFPDWIRLKDSSAVRCRIISDNDGKVVAVMAGGDGEGRVTIDRTQIEWLQRNSVPGKDRPPQGGDRPAKGARP